MLKSLRRCVLFFLFIGVVLCIFPLTARAEELISQEGTVTLYAGTYTIPESGVSITGDVIMFGNIVLSGNGTLTVTSGNISLQPDGSLAIEQGCTVASDVLAAWGNVTNNGTVQGVITVSHGNYSLINNGSIDGGAIAYDGTSLINNGTISSSSKAVGAFSNLTNNGTINVKAFSAGPVDSNYYGTYVNNAGASITCSECNGNSCVLTNYGTFTTRIYGAGLTIVGNEPIGVVEDRHSVNPSSSDDSNETDSNPDEQETLVEELKETNSLDEAKKEENNDNNEKNEPKVEVLTNGDADTIEGDVGDTSAKVYNISLAITPRFFSNVVKSLDDRTDNSKPLCLYSIWPISMNKSMLQSLANSNSPVEYYFWYKGHLYCVTIPPKTDATAVFRNNYTYNGPLYIGQMLGTSRLIK